MSRTLAHHWPQIRRVFAEAIRSSLHLSVASVDAGGNPTISPIGSVYLEKDRTSGYFFEIFTRKMPRNFKENQRICVMAVPSRMRQWFGALLRGRFKTPPGVRLYGTVRALRPARPEEVAFWRKRIRRVRFLKGHDLLWSDLSHVRDIQFDGWAPVNLGPMTRGCWDAS